MRTLGGIIDEVVWMVEGAENGECALNLMETSPSVPDVIIVDQYMETSGGQLLGHEVVAELRRNASFDHAVIIGCTGSMQTAGPFFMEAGCDVVWSKPMPSKEEAQTQIMELLKKRKNNSIASTGTPRQPSPFSLDQANTGFSSGLGAGKAHPVLQQSPMPTQANSHVTAGNPAPVSVASQPPVFRQMQSSPTSRGTESNAQNSYFVSATAADGSSSAGSVFQFGVAPSSPTNRDRDTAVEHSGSPPREEVSLVAETLSTITMR